MYTEEATLSLIRRKTMTQNTVSGIFCIISGAIFGLFGLYHLTQPRFFLPLAIFMAALCVGFIVGGVAFLKVGKEKMQKTKEPNQ